MFIREGKLGRFHGFLGEHHEKGECVHCAGSHILMTSLGWGLGGLLERVLWARVHTFVVCQSKVGGRQ